MGVGGVGIGGTFLGGEGLPVLDVELAHVDVDLALPAPHRNLLVLRYLREPTREGTLRVRVLGFRICNMDFDGNGARDPYLGHDGAVVSGFRGPLVPGGLALGRRLAPAPAAEALLPLPPHLRFLERSEAVSDSSQGARFFRAWTGPPRSG